MLKSQEPLFLCEALLQRPVGVGLENFSEPELGGCFGGKGDSAGSNKSRASDRRQFRAATALGYGVASRSPVLRNFPINFLRSRFHIRLEFSRVDLMCRLFMFLTH